MLSELWIHAFAFIDQISLLNVELSCKKFKKLLDRFIWQSYIKAESDHKYEYFKDNTNYTFGFSYIFDSNSVKITRLKCWSCKCLYNL